MRADAHIAQFLATLQSFPLTVQSQTNQKIPVLDHPAFDTRSHLQPITAIENP